MTDGELLASLVVGAIGEYGTSTVHLDRVARKWARQIGRERPGVLLEAQIILQHAPTPLDPDVRWAAVTVLRKARRLAQERTDLPEEVRLADEFELLERGDTGGDRRRDQV
ncbi:MAG: hypothetical protein AB7H43_07950 [Acidimicrobiia bacterium]